MEITPFTHDNKLGAVQEVLEKKKYTLGRCHSSPKTLKINFKQL